MSAAGSAVFLSYASQDAEAARRIAEALRAAGVEVWFDAEGGLETGDEWDAKIRRQIRECVLFLPVISANTEARHEGYFRIEWELAAQRALGIASGVPFIVPVVVDDTREAVALVPDRFRAVQWTRLPGGIMPPAIQQRFQKLWSHRRGAVRDPGPLPPVPSAVPPGVVRRRLGWAALALGLLGVGGYFGYRVYYHRQEAAVLAALNMTSEEPVRKDGRVLVVRLENRTGEPALDRVGEMVADHVRRRATELDWVAAAQAVPDGQRLKPEATPAEMQRLAEAAGGDLLVSGDYYLEAGKIFLIGRIFDLRQGRVVAELAPRTGDPGSVAPAVEDLAERLLGAMASVPRVRRGRDDMSKFVSFSVPRRFDAVQLMDQGADADLARYRRAYECDPEGSLSALVVLAVRQVFQGHYAEADAVVAEVEEARPRLQLVPYAAEMLRWAKATTRGDADGVEQALDTICRWVPSNRPWRAERIYALYRANKPRAILREFEGVAPGSPGENLGVVWYARAAAYFLLQDYPHLEEAGRRALAAEPKSDRAMQWLACGAALNGHYAETRRALDAYDGVRERSPEIFHLYVAVLAAMRRSDRANAPEFAEFLRRGEEWFASRPPADATAPGTRFARAEMDYVAGRYAEARREAEQLLQLTPDDVRLRAFAASAAIRLGDRAAGESTVAWLRTVNAKYQFGYVAFAQAKLAALLGQPDTALRLLREAYAQHSAAMLDFSWEGLGLSPDFESLRSDPRFQAFVAPRG